jgi:hypothetical protein
MEDRLNALAATWVGASLANRLLGLTTVRRADNISTLSRWEVECKIGCLVGGMRAGLNLIYVQLGG